MVVCFGSSLSSPEFIVKQSGKALLTIRLKASTIVSGIAK
jgi:hypothetical protein